MKGLIEAVRGLLLALGAVGIVHVSLASDVLPQPESPFKGKIGFNAAESTPDWPQPVEAPKGAPNIIVILLDDVGFAATSTFGGPVETPKLEKLAAQGLRYNRFHVSAQCSPTRAALLGGRNDHIMGFGAVGYGGFPGYNGIWKRSTASIAQILRTYGYSTAAIGKWHNTPAWETSPVGPFERWPTGLGFEYFYGVMTGSGSQYEPALYRNTEPVEPPATLENGYHFTTDITNEAIGWLHTHASLAAEKPYFLYFATAATHAPNQVPKEWIDKYRGHFDEGWDRLREQIFARQKALGVVPADAQLTVRPKELPAWNSLSAGERRLLARQMEVNAAFLAHTDYEVGRLLKAAQELPGSDNTLILYIVGDNGASSESGIMGDEIPNPTLAERLKHLDDLGGPRYANNQYASGWAWAMSTPFQWQKLIASHLGGIRDPLIVSWPARIKEHGGLRSQYTHVTDVAATLYEVAGITFPSEVDGVKQLPLDGVSFAASFERADAPSRHTLQIYEQWGNRAIYQDGWMASARHSVPWQNFPWEAGYRQTDLSKDLWELYHLDDDFSQARDVSKKFPRKLIELQALFDTEAKRNDIYPLSGADPLFSWESKKREFIYYRDLPRLNMAQVPDFTRSHRITADVLIPPGGAEGVIISNGQRNGGFVLYIKNHRVIYTNNYAGIQHDSIESTAAVPQGSVEIAFEFVREAAPSSTSSWEASGGVGHLYINGLAVGQRKLEHVGFVISESSSFNIGRARVSPVSPAFDLPFAFTGRIDKVTVELN